MKYKWNIAGFEGECDAPADDEQWTAQQLADYLGLVKNDKDGPPYLFSTAGGIIMAIREQIIQALRSQQEQRIIKPKIIS